MKTGTRPLYIHSYYLFLLFCCLSELSLADKAMRCPRGTHTVSWASNQSSQRPSGYPAKRLFGGVATGCPFASVTRFLSSTNPLTLAIITSVYLPYLSVAASCLSRGTHLRPFARNLAMDIKTISSQASSVVCATLPGGVRGRLFAGRFLVVTRGNFAIEFRRSGFWLRGS
jgi:hypothetical protein